MVDLEVDLEDITFIIIYNGLVKEVNHQVNKKFSCSMIIKLIKQFNLQVEIIQVL